MDRQKDPSWALKEFFAAIPYIPAVTIPSSKKREVFKWIKGQFWL
jgi:hypothetical protein